MSVWSETVDMAERHPFWVAGGFVAIVLLIVFAKGSGTSTKPQNFTFSYGPSDAQVLAGTQLQIAQAADQSAISAATIQADTTTKVANDYFNYLTGNSANQLTAVTGAQSVQKLGITQSAIVANNQIATAGNVATGAQGVQKAQIAATQATGLSQIAATQATGLSQIAAWLQATLGGQKAATDQAAIAGQTAADQAFYAAQTAQKTAEFGADASMYASGAQAYASTFSAIMSGQLSDIQKAAAGINA
jgi:hypothetical protein